MTKNKEKEEEKLEIHHGHHGSMSSSKDYSAEFDESELSLSDRLKAFKASHFDPEGYVITKCRAMSEKEIRHLCSYLIHLKKASAEEMRKSVYANYSAFIRTSREISELEGQLLSLRNLLSTRANLIAGLADGVNLDTLPDENEGSTNEDILNVENREPSKMEKWLAQFMETLEVYLAERRVDEALDALDRGEIMADEAKFTQALSPSALFSLKTTITEKRQQLADQLAEAACQPSISSIELRSVVKTLKQLGDGPRAHALLLKSHHQKLQSNMQGLRPSGTSCGAAHTTSLSQLLFSTIAQAAGDSLAIFDDEPAYASGLVTWAVNQVETFALLVKKHVIASPAAAGVLGVVAQSVQVSLGHCSLLETRGLALSPVLLKFFRPCVEQALNASFKRIEQSTAALAAADDWSLTYPPLGARSLSSASFTNLIASQPQLSSSAHRFNTMAQEMFEDISPLECLQLGNQALEGLIEVFNAYINMLINALPGSMETENSEGYGNRIVNMANTEAQQVALLANALLLGDELLPRAALKLSPSQLANTPRRHSDRQNRFPEQRELKKRLQRLVDQLRDSFCRQHALDLIFTEDGGVRLNPEMYLSMDSNTQEPEWFPSQIYQELYGKLTLIASIASDMFVGKERFATILLMRLTETVILWLSEDQTFWEDIETGPRPLGPLGLQQFYLDMEFVILFASQGRYLSRNLHQVIRNIISRAIEAVSVTGLDPYSTLPEDDWFAEVAEIAIKMLSGKANFGNEESLTSPTAASLYSHGSN